MKPLFRLLPILALLVGAAVVERADAATSLAVNCTFTISKDVTIAWAGTGPGAITGSAPVTWPIGAATLGTSYSTVDNTSGWPLANGTTLVIANNSLTAELLNLSVTATSTINPSGATGWSAAASAGANQFVAAVTAAASNPGTTGAVITAGKITPTNATFASNIAAGATTSPLYFAITVPTSITSGGNNYIIAFTFTGSAP